MDRLRRCECWYGPRGEHTRLYVPWRAMIHCRWCGRSLHTSPDVSYTAFIAKAVLKLFNTRKAGMP